MNFGVRLPATDVIFDWLKLFWGNFWTVVFLGLSKGIFLWFWSDFHHLEEWNLCWTSYLNVNCLFQRFLSVLCFFFLLLVLNYLDSSVANIGSGWTFVRHPPYLLLEGIKYCLLSGKESCPVPGFQIKSTLRCVGIKLLFDHFDWCFSLSSKLHS